MTPVSLAEPPSRKVSAAPIEASVQRLSDPMLDVVILAAACGVLLLAAILETRGGTAVVLPVLGIPLPELCYARRWLGIECPGCGLTRSFIAIMHGDFTSAWLFNPAGVAFFAAVAFQLPYRAIQLQRLHRGQRQARPVWLNWLWAPVGIALVIQWIARF